MIAAVFSIIAAFAAGAFVGYWLHIPPGPPPHLLDREEFMEGYRAGYEAGREFERSKVGAA